jgi:hypothetical protein
VGVFIHRKLSPNKIRDSIQYISEREREREREREERYSKSIDVNETAGILICQT